MKTYTYYYGKRKKTAIEVDEKLYKELQEMDIMERNANRRYRRHCIPLSLFDVEEDERFIDPNGDAYDELIRKLERERVQTALETLSESELWLVERHFFDGLSERKISFIEGIPLSEVHNKLLRLKKKLRKILA